MTLVQNHQRLLNGNSKYLLLLFIAFTIQSCGLFNKTKRTVPPPPPPPVEEEVVVEEEPVEEIEVEIPNEPKDTIVIPDPVIEEKEEINIAVMLPFQLDKMDQTNSLPRASEYSLHIYKGIQYAMQDAYFEDKEVNVYVIDNFGNAETTLQQLQKHPFPKVDAVIGPLYTDAYKAVSSFAEANKIPFISPLSSAEDLGRANKYLYSANATASSRYEVMLDFAQSQFINPNLILLYQPVRKEEKAKEEILTIAGMKNITVTDQISEGTEMFSAMEKLFQKGRENVIITTVDDNDAGARYFENLMYYLNARGLDYNLKLMATQEWNIVSNIIPAKYPNLSVFILDKYLDTTNTTRLNDFNRLISKNGGPMYEHTLQGYDIMSFLLSSIDKYGKDFKNHLTEEEFQGLQTKFNFGRFMRQNGFAFYDNKYINILQYRNGRWEKAN